MTLAHTHDTGQPCLACDVSEIREHVPFGGMLRGRFGAAIDRIEAALGDLAHLERAAQLLSDSPPGENFRDYQSHCEEWRKAERARKERSG